MIYGSILRNLNRIQSDIFEATNVASHVAAASQSYSDAISQINDTVSAVSRVNSQLTAAATQVPDLSSIHHAAFAHARVINSTLAEIARMPSLASQQFNQFHAIVSEAARISNIANVVQSFDIQSHLAAVRETLAILPERSTIAALEAEIEKHHIRDAAYAEWEREGFADEQKSVESKLSPNFDALGLNEKLEQLLTLAEENQSSKLMVYVAGVATNLISDALGFIDKKWLCIFVVMVMFLEFAKPKQRLQKIRQALGSLADPQTRIVTHSCKAYRNPKRKSAVLGRLQVGLPVRVADKFGGWQQVYLTVGNRQIVAWVRSKYLGKAR